MSRDMAFQGAVLFLLAAIYWRLGISPDAPWREWLAIIFSTLGWFFVGFWLSTTSRREW